VTVSWGVVGPGGIATRFAQAIELVADGRIAAVSSRSIDRANAFGDRFGIPHRYADDDELAADPTVDAVYVATPHSRHERDALRFLAAGRAVLCEKPFAPDAAATTRMAAAARDKGVFAMEALWSRFLPSYRILVDLVGSGRIGEPQLVEADFGFRVPVNPSHRLFDPALAGGALLDLGIYPVHLASLVLGPVEHVVADGVIGPTGVDEHVAAVLRHPGDRLSVVKAAIRVNMACTARIAGTDGTIDLPAFMHCPQSLTVRRGTDVDVIDASFEGEGLRFEIDEVHRSLEAGLTESPTMPLADTISMARTLDRIRDSIRATGAA
jgi:predicted dehydrogenase